jgi:hypothetical protein
MSIGGKKDAERVERMIRSIDSQGIPEWEIVLVSGGPAAKGLRHERLRLIPFDESERPIWTTKKTNLITKNAKYENVVYAHDYYHFEEGGYRGWEEYGDDWDVAVNRVHCNEGSRLHDWLLSPWCTNVEELHRRARTNGSVLPYEADGETFTPFMFIGGAFFLSKRSFMKRVPFDESIYGCRGEDIVWSHAARKLTTFKMNTKSLVKSMRPDKKPLLKPLVKGGLPKLIEAIEKGEFGEDKCTWTK